MTTKFKVLVGCLVLLFAMLIYLETTEKEDINWFPTYSKKDKIPYGTFVLYNTLKESRGAENIVDVNRPPFEVLQDSSFEGTYFFINTQVPFDEAEANRLLKWVTAGNTLFVASNSMPEALLDTLNLETQAYYDLDNLENKPVLQLSNPALQRKNAYYIDLEIGATEFNEIDTLETVVVGEFDLNKGDTTTLEEPKTHFIEQAFGEGKIYLHLMPTAFTNYNMLYEYNYRYVENALRYLPENETIYWDDHYKNGKTVQQSPLYIFLNNRYLKWAYYLLIIGVLLWVIFEGKRKQRAIPIVKPLSNKTLDFTETIAGMYLDKMDHRSIAFHQINHFFEFLRSEYLVNTGNRDKQFLEKVSLKSGNSEEETKNLFQFIDDILSTGNVSQEILLDLNKRIEQYKSTT
ncbi:DUF4350 domain-containing protein [Dokdonia sinensis]|uniref:DUF4350 domain-containing protein n=1 Tax=Dokdonia sinensis TaxID=2479847 RepID=A0A3M0H2Y8_9FLAO|nr:DUF4350 domain-containing protein [Dokdonia sinensis]RMB64026.1 DUF4350 domain-containing protein [Dokdonia sinensis]